jgi:hypothetical protein
MHHNPASTKWIGKDIVAYGMAVGLVVGLLIGGLAIPDTYSSNYVIALEKQLSPQELRYIKSKVKDAPQSELGLRWVSKVILYRDTTFSQEYRDYEDGRRYRQNGRWLKCVVSEDGYYMEDDGGDLNEVKERHAVYGRWKPLSYDTYIVQAGLASAGPAKKKTEEPYLIKLDEDKK